MNTYLYIKQHLITGKLYFGKTIKNPEKYLGSGKLWSRHITKHGKEHVVTLWYELFSSDVELSNFAIDFSIKLDIINSTTWLNMINENGFDGAPIGNIPWNKGKTGVQPKQTKEILAKRFSPEARKKMSDAKIGKTSHKKGKTGYKSNMPKCSCIICKKILPINTITLHYVKH